MFSWKMTKMFFSQICLNIYYMQKFYLNEKSFITIFSEKFPNQCKGQTSNVPSNILSYKRPHLECGTYVYVKNKVDSQIYWLIYNFNVYLMFTRIFVNIYSNAVG